MLFTASHFFTLAVPAFLGLMALLVGTCWYAQRRHAYLGWFAASCLTAGVVFTWQGLVTVERLWFWAPYQSLLYLLATVLFVNSVASRFRLRLYPKLMLALGLATVFGVYYFARVQDALLSRIAVFSFGLGLLMLHVVPQLLRLRLSAWPERGLRAVYIVYTLFMLCRPIARWDFFLYSGGKQLEPGALFGQTSLWWLSITGVLLVCFLYGSLLLATAVRDVVRQLSTERDNDPLTGLLNRRAFHEAAEPFFLPSQRKRGPISVIMGDLDHFKSVNDKWGHSAGDHVLTAFAQILRGEVRETDLVARFGGEEFVVLLYGADRPQAQAVAERVRRRIAAQTFASPWEALRVTASFGLVQEVGNDSLDDMLQRADHHLYCAKRAGRNQVYA